MADSGKYKRFIEYIFHNYHFLSLIMRKSNQSLASAADHIYCSEMFLPQLWYAGYYENPPPKHIFYHVKLNR